MALTSSVLSRKSCNRMDPDTKQVYVSLNGIGATTLTTLISNVEASTQIQVFGIMFSSDVASAFILQSDANPIIPLNMGSSGGLANIASNGEIPILATNLGESLKLYNVASLAAAANAGVYIQYKERISV
jgi:hypothetical protein